ncbi:MAG: LptF/LptG family permease [Mariprofundus sp.]|nr:LptF/LptG family permease [Mariprofundus sp.]
MTLDRYILRMWLGPFLGGLFLVLAVMLLGRTLKLLAEVSDSSAAWLLIGELLVLTTPYFLLLTVPMAFFLSLQNTISSLQQSSEMDALRASGISYRRMFRVFFVIVGLLWLGLSYASMVLLPQGQLGFNNILVKVYAMKGAISFAPQRFTQGLDGITVYVDGEDEVGNYHGLILEDHRDGVSVIYTAKEARFEMGGAYLLLKLKDGVRLEGEGEEQRMLSFDRYQVSIPVPVGQRKILHSKDHVTMMTVSELWHALQSTEDGPTIAEWHRRLLLPTTIIILFFFALPLTLTQKRSGKAGSMIAGVAMLVIVYNVQLLLQHKVSQAVFPGWSMWLGQAVLLGLGVYLSKRAETDRLPKLFGYVGEWIFRLHQLIMKGLARRWKS